MCRGESGPGNFGFFFFSTIMLTTQGRYSIKFALRLVNTSVI